MPHRRDIHRKADDLVGHLSALTRRFMLQGQVDKDSDVPLTRQEARVVAVIGHDPGCTMSELAGRMLLSMSSLTSVVDKLVRKRLVVRERSEDDRRVVRVGLTPRGRGLCDHFRRNRLRMAHAMLSSLGEREQDVFMGLIEKISSTVHNTDSRIDRPPQTEREARL